MNDGLGTKAVVEIDGADFSTLEEFFSHFDQRALCGQHDWGRNLDAFNDVLRGGFGTPDGGFVLRWKQHALSRQRLGHAETVRQLRLRLQRCHPDNTERVRADLDRALLGQGATVFDWLVGIVRVHGPDGAEAQDGVELALD
ncbi:barstar family protein [Lysobacter sp. 5GHs7-4]|uniref:barstar family protein n=1 Tax=Lysobacter sp. 5GHs7-4 TaxID=2904253 RepID=UPI001E348C28|nr:barstar family protein [Lysobacter sp. 5GHs7-4]UHQ24547.1 barstar family protein [Lysobacter sp. 5GHs7-4]